MSDQQCDVTDLTNGTSGFARQTGGAPGTEEITAGGDTGGDSVNFARTTGNRVLTGVSNAEVSATSDDAANGSPLHGVQATAEGALQRTGGSMTGNVNMGGNTISGPAGRVSSGDTVNKGHLDGIQAQNDVKLDMLTTGLKP